MRPLLVACLGLWLGGAVALADVASDRAALLDGVEVLPQVGIPGPIAVFGADAFAVLTGQEGERPRAVVAAARLGDGRAVAFGHNGYVGPRAFESPGGGRLLANAVRWVGGDAPRVRLPRRRGELARFLFEEGCAVAQCAPDLRDLQPGDVLLWTDELDVPPERLVAHVRGGGGLVVAVCPWGTQQVRGRSGFALHEDLEQNHVLEPLGLVFALGYLKAGEDGFRVDRSRPDAVHAGAACAALEAGAATPAQLRLLADTVRALPGDAPFLARLRAGLPELTQGPTPDTPLVDPRARLAVAVRFHVQRALSPTEVRPAPGVDAFPGAVSADAPRLERRLQFAASTPGWHSTGLYVPPGEVVELRRDGRAAGWTVRVGCHTDRLWSKARWERWPEVSRTWALGTRSALTLASPFGGLLYLEPGEGAQDLELVVAGVVEAPRFDLADPASVEGWATRRAAPGPWAELQGRRLILTVPSAAVRALDDPATLLAWWDRVVASHDALAQLPLGARAERVVADVQLSGGYMHSGYPIMTHLDVATGRDGQLAKVLDLERLKREGSWGHFHELGHNRQEGAWTFAGTGEVTCNLFTLYAMDTVVGIEPWEHPWLAGGRERSPQHLAAGAPFRAWKQDPGVALVFYAELQRAFGWEPFQAVFRDYAAAPRSERPQGDAEKRDQWLLRFSRAVERDLGPFFERWGIPVSAEARAQLSELEPWLPGE